VATGFSRAELVRRGVVGGGALIVSASGLAVLPAVASADGTLPDGDLAYLRLLIAAELLAVDFQTRALGSGRLGRAAHTLLRRVRSDETAHYDKLAAVMTAAGQAPATAADIDFSYPKGGFRTSRSITTLAARLEHLLVGAYVGAVENVETAHLRRSIGQIAASEAQHQAGLAALHGESPVGKAFAPVLSIGQVSNALDEFES
jgi:Ferritin-like domain